MQIFSRCGEDDTIHDPHGTGLEPQQDLRRWGLAAEPLPYTNRIEKVAGPKRIQGMRLKVRKGSGQHDVVSFMAECLLSESHALKFQFQ